MTGSGLLRRLRGRLRRGDPDPAELLDAAVDQARQQHELVLEQARAVVATQRRLQLQLGRAIEDVERLRAATAQALRVAEAARLSGDARRLEAQEAGARAVAAHLVAAERRMEGLKQLHDDALAAAGGARDAVERSRDLLQRRLLGSAELRGRLERARLMERLGAALGGLGPDGGGAAMERARAAVEERYVRALGAAGALHADFDASILEVERALLHAAGEARLEEIRGRLGLPAAEPAVRVEEPPPGGGQASSAASSEPT